MGRDVKKVACVIIENDEDVFELSLKSYIDHVDKVIIIDGNKERKNFQDIVNDLEYPPGFFEIIHSPYPHYNKGADGKQRNVYLDYLKKHHIGDWAIVIDADEVVTGWENFDQLISSGYDCLDVHMEHFIGNLGKVDASVERHYVQRRIFKVNKDVKYPEAEHVLPTPFDKTGRTDLMSYWHLGYAREIFRLHKKYKNHCAKSNIHTPQFLQQWYGMHALGTYPIKPFPTSDVPKIILKHFDLDFVEEVLYFMNRDKIEAKHFMMVNQWKEYFKNDNVIDVGCGMGHYLYAWTTYGIDSKGLEKSKFACDNNPYKFNLIQKDLTEPWDEITPKFNLVTCLDVLEHLDYDKLTIALENLKKLGKTFLFSIPFLGDPNLDLDETHIIKESKEWWVRVLEEQGFKVSDVPEHFMFKQQLLEATL